MSNDGRTARPSLRLTPHRSGTRLWLAGGLALVLVLALVSFNSAGPGEVAAGAPGQCTSDFVIDFAGLPHGTILGEQYADRGVHITAVGTNGPDAAIVFDTNRPPTHDPDLAVDVGNIAILARNLNGSGSDGIVNDPDENNFGGKQIYSFDQPVSIGSFLFIDKDHGTPDKAIAYDASNDVIKQVPIPVSTNGSVQEINVDADNVSRLEIVYRDSGGLTGIEVDCPNGGPTASPSGECPPPGFVINFAGLAHGTILGEQYASQGVHISAVGTNGPDAAIVFDTNRPPTHDPDLAVDIGNIAILARSLSGSGSDGIVDDPDENNFGGKVTFTFDRPVHVGSIIFVDHDHQPSDHIDAYDAAGNLIKTELIPVLGNGSVQTISINADGVSRLELVYKDSAGFTGIEIECVPGTGTPTPIAQTSTPTATPGQAHADTDCHAGSGGHADTDCHAGSGGHADTDCHAGWGGHADADCHGGWGVHADANRHAHDASDGNPYSDRNASWNADRNSPGNGDGYSSGNGNRDPAGHRDAHAGGHAYRDSFRADCDPDSFTNAGGGDGNTCGGNRDADCHTIANCHSDGDAARGDSYRDSTGDRDTSSDANGDSVCRDPDGDSWGDRNCDAGRRIGYAKSHGDRNRHSVSGRDSNPQPGGTRGWHTDADTVFRGARGGAGTKRRAAHGWRVATGRFVCRSHHAPWGPHRSLRRDDCVRGVTEPALG